MRRRKRTVHPLAISATVILATIAVTFYAFNQGLPFVRHFTLYALVNNSVNVRSGSPVRIAGIDVGAVDGVSPAGAASKIKFSINDSGLPVHTDATIHVRDRLFLEGGYYLELNPGSPTAPVMHDGEEIPLSQTSTPVQFYNVLSMFNSATRASLTNLVRTLNEGFSPAAGRPLSDSGAAGFKTAIPQLTPVFKDTAVVTRALRGTREGDVRRLLRSTAALTTTLADNDGQLVDLLSALNATSGALASSDGALASSVAGIDQTLQAAPPALSAIDAALPPLARLARTLDPSLRVAPPILDALIGSVRQLASVLEPVERGRLLASLNATFAGFPTLLNQLASSFPVTKLLSDCLQRNVVPVLEQTVPDGPLSSGRPVWQDFIHFLPGVGGATGSFDANGPYTRTVLGAGTNTVTGGTLASLPGVGQLVGSAPPGNGSILGARPSWIGDLTANDFHPEAPCTTQRVPSLTSPTAAADVRTIRSAAPGAAVHARARRLLGR